MKGDIVVRKDIELLVNEFYEKVRLDNILAPHFIHVQWQNHLPLMYKFWSSMILGEQSYRGNPLQKHLDLPIGPAEFDQWLRLFTTVVDEHFSGPNADEIKMRARSIANVFQFKMGVTRVD